MRCQCCNKNLSDYESTLRHPETLEFLDICVKCLKDIPVTPIEPKTLSNDVGYDDDQYDEFPVTDEQWVKELYEDDL